MENTAVFPFVHNANELRGCTHTRAYLDRLNTKCLRFCAVLLHAPSKGQSRRSDTWHVKQATVLVRLHRRKGLGSTPGWYFGRRTTKLPVLFPNFQPNTIDHTGRAIGTHVCCRVRECLDASSLTSDGAPTTADGPCAGGDTARLDFLAEQYLLPAGCDSAAKLPGHVYHHCCC